MYRYNSTCCSSSSPPYIVHDVFITGVPSPPHSPSSLTSTPTTTTTPHQNLSTASSSIKGEKKDIFLDGPISPIASRTRNLTALPCWNLPITPVPTPVPSPNGKDYVLSRGGAGGSSISYPQYPFPSPIAHLRQPTLTNCSPIVLPYTYYYPYTVTPTPLCYDQQPVTPIYMSYPPYGSSAPIFCKTTTITNSPSASFLYHKKRPTSKASAQVRRLQKLRIREDLAIEALMVLVNKPIQSS